MDPRNTLCNRLLLVPTLAICGLSGSLAQGMSASALRIEPRTEYLADPIGIDSRAPRFSWAMEGGETGMVQRAYRIDICTDSNALRSCGQGRWRRDAASSSQLVVYAEPILRPFTTYYCRMTELDGA